MLNRPSNQMPRTRAPEADHYVGSSHEPFERCFTAVEPYQSGTRSPRVVGEFCEPPMARFTLGGVETLIYKVLRH